MTFVFMEYHYYKQPKCKDYSKDVNADSVNIP